jgi:outer membrane murein-binding lipoprotein Lpp
MDSQTTQQPQQSMISQPLTPSTQTPKHSKLLPAVMLLVLVLIIGVGFGVYSWQHSKVSDANTKVSNLQSQVTSLQSQVNKLNKDKTQSTTSTSTQSNKSTTRTTTPYPTLSPATVPSKVATCSQAISVGNDGMIGPTYCSSGPNGTDDEGVNVLAWQYIASHYAPIPPTTMSLGYNATEQQVCTDMGNDINSGNSGDNGTMQEEFEAVGIAGAYYGWSFTDNLIRTFVNTYQC